MPTVREIAQGIVAREGGFVNDPDDPGGATNFGVTIGTTRKLGIDINQDGQIDVADVRLMTAARAVDLFIGEYFRRPRIDLLPEGLHASVFDMAVNAGSNAVKILQRLLRDLGHDIAADGAIGPATARAAAAEWEKSGQVLADAYGIARRNYYFRLADARPASRKFARRSNGGKGGWIVRAEEFISPRFHLSAAAFQERVSKWA